MFLVMSGGISSEQAFCVIQNGQLYIYISIFVVSVISYNPFSLLALPLFNPTKIFLHNLQRFQASLLMAASDHLIVNNDPLPSQRQSSNSSSINIHDRNDSQHTSATNISTTTTTTGGGQEVDSGAFGDFINLKIAPTRQNFISVR